uniref:PCNA-associated factor n=1 Tax=Vombatus ursinus TaxID=29139 RepID=A0A4X2KY71_VOMUR
IVQTNVDCMPGSYYKKVEDKYAGGNPVCVWPTPTWQKGIGEFFEVSPKYSEKENQILDEAEAENSGLGKPKRESHPLQPDLTEDGGCPDED